MEQDGPKAKMPPRASILKPPSAFKMNQRTYDDADIFHIVIL